MSGHTSERFAAAVQDTIDALVALQAAIGENEADAPTLGDTAVCAGCKADIVYRMPTPEEYAAEARRRPNDTAFVPDAGGGWADYTPALNFWCIGEPEGEPGPHVPQEA